MEGKGIPRFRIARYLFAQAEWDYWRSEEGRPNLLRTGDYISDSVIPVVEAGLVDFVDTNHRIDEHVAMVPAPGHTPGQICVSIESNGSRAMLAGDMLHSPLQLTYPEWSTRFCADPIQSRKTRLGFLENCADRDIVVFPSHFPSPTAGYIRRIDDAFRLEFIADQ